MISVISAINCGAKRLIRTSNTPKLDSEILLSSVLKKTRMELIAFDHSNLTRNQILQFSSYLCRREKYEPISYILNYKEFWSKKIIINKNTLIPRPETEVLVGMALNKHKGKEKLRFLDLGIGTGCISISILSEIKKATGVGVDICPKALAICRQNLNENKLNNRIKLLRRDIRKNSFNEVFDLIISNPPYLREKEFININKSIKLYEPKKSLVSDNMDGLKYINYIIRNYQKNLKVNGILAVEIGNYQFKKVFKMLNKYKFRVIKSFKLVNNDIRCIIATKI